MASVLSPEEREAARRAAAAGRLRTAALFPPPPAARIGSWTRPHRLQLIFKAGAVCACLSLCVGLLLAVARARAGRQGAERMQRGARRHDGRSRRRRRRQRQEGRLIHAVSDQSDTDSAASDDGTAAEEHGVDLANGRHPNRGSGGQQHSYACVPAEDGGASSVAPPPQRLSTIRERLSRESRWTRLTNEQEDDTKSVCAAACDDRCDAWV